MHFKCKLDLQYAHLWQPVAMWTIYLYSGIPQRALGMVNIAKIVDSPLKEFDKLQGV